MLIRNRAFYGLVAPTGFSACGGNNWNSRASTRPLQGNEAFHLGCGAVEWLTHAASIVRCCTHGQTDRRHEGLGNSKTPQSLQGRCECSNYLICFLLALQPNRGVAPTVILPRNRQQVPRSYVLDV